MVGEGEPVGIGLFGIGLFGTEPLCGQECQIHRARENKREWLAACRRDRGRGRSSILVCLDTLN